MKIFAKTEDGATKELDLYSKAGLALVSELWIKSAFYHRIMYESTWLGLPIIQLPNDMVMMQELIWKIRPDIIIETGVAHGGGAVFYASILELIGKGVVIGIDIDIRKYNELSIRSHPLSKRIELFQGSSTDLSVVNKIRTKMKQDENVLVILDSNHSYEHVLTEMRIYKDFIAPGGYMIIMDGVQELLYDTPSGSEQWKNDNPLAAIREFLAENNDWEIDSYYNRTHISCIPSGFLRRCEHK